MTTTTIDELHNELYGDRDRPIGLVSRVKTLEDYVAEQKSNRLWLIALTVGVAADVLANVLPLLL